MSTIEDAKEMEQHLVKNTRHIHGSEAALMIRGLLRELENANRVVEAAKILSKSDTWDVANTDEWMDLDAALAALDKQLGGQDE